MVNIEMYKKIPNKNKIIFINTDETPTFIDFSQGRTYSFKGQKEILVNKTNKSKLRITTLLSITFDGKKLPPLLIFKKPKSSKIIKNS